MAEKNEVVIPEENKKILNYINDNTKRLEQNKEIFEILEGDLLKYVLQSLSKQFAKASDAQEICERCPPINILKKFISKLSKIYVSQVVRTVTGSEQDNDLIKLYESRGLNHKMISVNENFNAYKFSGLEIFQDKIGNERILNFRTPPSHLFLVFNNTPENPMQVDGWIKILKNRIHVYTDDSFRSMTPDGQEYKPDYEGNDGDNVLGLIPFEYIARSDYDLIPIMDTDTKQMAVLLPVILGDLNFSLKYNMNPIVYGIDLDAENLSRNPNVFWNFASQETGRNPQIGSIKPEVNISDIMNSVKDQYSMWLASRNVRAGTIGNLTVENAASGISLMILEMDTTEDRKIQQIYFEEFEHRFWQRLAKIHNDAVRNGLIDETRLFSEKISEIKVIYAEPKPIVDRSEIVARVRDEISAGLNTRFNGIKELNPNMSDDDINKLIEQIDEEVEVPIESEEAPPMQNEKTDEMMNE